MRGIINMANISEVKDIVKNHEKMKKYEKDTGRIGKAYMIISGSLIFICIGCMLMTWNLAGIIDIITLSAVFGFGYGGVYCRSSQIAAAAPLVSLIAILFFDSTLAGMYYIILPLSVVLMLLTFRVNSTYSYLSQQPGFPQFDELFEAQKVRSAEATREKEEYFKRFKKKALAREDSFADPSDEDTDKTSFSGRGFMDSI